MKRRTRHIAIWIVSIFCIGLVAGIMRFSMPTRITRVQVEGKLTHCLTYKDRAYVACLRTEFAPILRSTTIAQILAYIEEATDYGSAIQTNGAAICHEAGHVLAGELVRLGKSEVGEVIASCGSRCGYGCIHGAMYAAASQDPARIATLASLCQGSGRTSFSLVDQGNCYHGLGHFLTEYFSYNIDAAIVRCQELDSRVAEQCMAGAVMELFAPKDQQIAHTTFPENIERFCISLPNVAWGTCINLLASMEPGEQGVSEGVNECLSMHARLQHDCLLGKAERVYRQAQGNPHEILQLCTQDPRFAQTCVEGVLAVALNMDPSGNVARTLCIDGGEHIAAQCARMYLQ
jgi:hypothetical protein